MQAMKTTKLRRLMRAGCDDGVMSDVPRRTLVSTGEAASALGIDRTTLARWAAAGSATPAGRTVGGHLRWNIEDLRAELANLNAASAGEA